jgi:competence protein ComEC
LLTGDVELDAQADLLVTRTDLRADVLKVPHHGSPCTQIVLYYDDSARSYLLPDQRRPQR